MFFVLRDVWLFWSLNVVAFLYIFVFIYLFEPVFVVEILFIYTLLFQFLQSYIVLKRFQNSLNRK